MATGTAIGVNVIGIIYIVLMIIMAVFVYNDAKKRKMNEVVWALVALLVPFLIGAILYFANREPIVDLQCSNCGEPVKEYEKICPKCGGSLLVNCPQCSFPIKKGWKSCPQCGVVLPENYNQPVKNYEKETGVGVILLIVVVALLVLIVFPVNFFKSDEVTESYGIAGNYGMYNITAEELSNNKTLKKWIEDSKVDYNEKISVIVSKTDGTMYVYVKNSEYLLSVEDFTCSENGDERIDICINIAETEYKDNYGYDFFMYDLGSEDVKNIDDKSEIIVRLGIREYIAKTTITDEDISRETWRE